MQKQSSVLPVVSLVLQTVTVENPGTRQLGISGTQLVKCPPNNMGTRGEWSYYVEQTKNKQAMA